MLTQHEIAAASAALSAAYASRRPIAPLSEQYPGMTVADAYEIQRRQVEQWVHSGRAIQGYKVGLTSLAMQQQLGVDEPDYGMIVDGMVCDTGATLPADTYIASRVEPEIAFTLAHELRGPGLTLAEVTAAVGEVVASLEIIDSRIADWRITLADTIADNASSAGVVLGSVRRPLAEIDIEALQVTLQLDGELVGEGRGADVMGSPLHALLWVANRLGELGVALHAGALVMPGSVCVSAPLPPGAQVRADFGELGVVECRREGAPQ